MALIRKIGEIEVYESSEDLSKYTRKQREQIVDELFKSEYVGKKVDLLINKEIIKANINKFTRKNVLAKVHHGYNQETNSEFNTRIDIIASGDYITLIKNALYIHSKNEEKAKQNEVHKKDTMCITL